MKFLSLFTLLFCVSELTLCANILSVAPALDFNYKKMYFPLWKKLASRGHKITLITTSLMEPNENITQIDISRFEIYNRLSKGSIFRYRNPSFIELMVDGIMREQFNDSAIQKLVKNGKFDLMFLELGFPYWSVLAAKFDCPFIGFSNKDAPPTVHYYVGNPIHPALYPWEDHHVERLNVSMRLKSTVITSFALLMTRLMSGGTGAELINLFVEEGLPDSLDIYGSMSLMFINANPMFHPARPLTPNTINLGGFLSIADPRKLPEVMK